MKARRLEEALDECLCAYLEGRRSIEESLSLYPALRDDLEPLLRTAIQLADSLSEASPPLAAMERGRQEFLMSASVRRRARELTRDVGFSRGLARAAWGRRPFALLAGAVAVTSVVVAAVTATELDNSSQVSAPPPSAAPAVRLSPSVGDLRQAQEELRTEAAEGGEISAKIRELARTTTELESQVEDFASLDGRSQEQLVRAIAYQYVLLQRIVNSQPPDAEPAARLALGITADVAEGWGVELPDPPPGGDVTEATPSPEPSPADTPIATPSSAPTASATPTPALEGSPTPQPVPSAVP